MRPKFPPLLRPLVTNYGGDRIRQVGLSALGYPVEWATSFSEVRTILEILKEGQHGDTGDQ